MVTEEYIDAFGADLRGRVLGDARRKIFFDDLPSVVNSTLVYCNLDANEVSDFVNAMEDADQVRHLCPRAV